MLSDVVLESFLWYDTGLIESRVDISPSKCCHWYTGLTVVKLSLTYRFQATYPIIHIVYSVYRDNAAVNNISTLPRQQR
jgi:hypothetical protein